MEQIKNNIGENRKQAFISNILNACMKNPKLKICKPETVLLAAFQGEALGLSAQLGQYYFVPYGKNNPVSDHNPAIAVDPPAPDFQHLQQLPPNSDYEKD